VPAFSFRNIGINEGLSQSSVVDIAIDKTGFLWLATQDGLNRYDGKEFRVFNRNFDDVTTSTGNKLGKIIPGNGQELWLITSGGRLEKFDLYTHSFQKLDKLTADSIVLPPVSCLYVTPDQLWIGTETEGLIVYEPGTKRMNRYSIQPGSAYTLSDNHIQSIHAGKKNQYWILTKNGVTLIDTDKKKSAHFHRQADSSRVSRISFSDADQDEDQTLWLASFGKGVFVKTDKDSTLIPFTGFGGPDSIPGNLVVECIKADQAGRIWVGTFGKGLYIISKKDRTIHHFLADRTKPFSLSYNEILSITKDSSGGMWIGTDGGGVSYYHNALNNFQTYSNFNLPAAISIEQVRSVVTDKTGMIWAGTSSQGLVFIDPLNSMTRQFHFPPFKKTAVTPERIVSLLCDEEGDIWVGTQGNGLMILDGKTKNIKKWFHPDGAAPLKIPDHTIWCMLPDQQGRVWIGTQNAGVCLISKQYGVISNLHAGPGFLADNNVRAIIKMNDSILCIGYERKGIQLLNQKTRQLTSLPGPESDKTLTAQTTLKCLFFRAPFLLAGTLGKGLLIYDLSTGKTTVITESNGLPNNTIYGILEDRQGYLWMSSNKGLCRFRLPRDPAAINPSYFTVFDVEDGLQSNEFNTGAYHASTGGTLFFGGIKGLNFFNPAYFTTLSQNIPVVITQTTINNEVFNGDTIISYKKALKLAYHQNSVSFNFAALDFLSGARVNYSYRLAGYDNNWINAGNRNYAAYTNLSPGKYVFEVTASNQANGTASHITRLFINIIPPFWQTWWFIGICLAAIAGTLYAFYRYRVNQLLKLQQVRSRIATDLHDDIGSTLTNINILSELSKKNIENKPEAEKFLNRITEEVNASGQALDDIVWSINKNNDTIEQTIARMRRYAAEIFEGTNINYSLQSDEHIPDRKLNMELRRDYFLLFKESITNVYKHAKAKNVRIKVWLEKNRLLFMITDDGIGFDSKVPTHRNGIKNMFARAEKWNGNVTIQSAPGKGTVMRISLVV
jgi:ligand-binding sensor domain-containing protein/signal transduction histidine kinase